MGFIARAFALLLGGLAVAEAGNTCTDYDGIGRNTCVVQGNSCEWCGTYYGGTKCSNSAWAGGCSSGWKSTPAPPPPPTCSSYTSDTTPGSFSDGSGSSNYGDNKDCAWKLRCPSGQNVRLSFSSFDTELNFDHVTLYDGETTSSSQLGRFSGPWPEPPSGSSIPSTTTSSGRYMRVRFTTDGGVTRSGWSASWSCTSSSSSSSSGSGTCSTTADLGSNGCCSNGRCPSSCSGQSVSNSWINGRSTSTCSCTGCAGSSSSRRRSSSSRAPPPPPTCTRGQYLSGGSCRSCAAGKYQSSSSHTRSSCTSCASGQYSTSGSSSCSTCAAGKYQSSSGQSSCITCAAGKQDTSSRTTCSTCSAGTYSRSDRTSCSSCPSGKTSAAGSDSSSDCYSNSSPTDGSSNGPSDGGGSSDSGVSGGAIAAVVFVFFALSAAFLAAFKFCETPDQRDAARQAAARHLATGKAALHKLTAHGALEATPQAPQSQWTSNPTADIECAQAQAEPTGQATEASDASEQPAPAVAKAAAVIQPGAPPMQHGPASDFVTAALLPVGMFAASAVCNFLSGSALTTGCLENDLGIEIGGVELGDLDVPGADALGGETCPVTGFLFADLNIGNDIKDGRVYASPNYLSTGFGMVSVLCGLFILFGSKRETKGAGQCAGILAFIAALVGAILTRINRQQYWAAVFEDNAAAQALNMVAEASGSDETLCDVFEMPVPDGLPPPVRQAFAAWDGVRPCALAGKAQALSCAAAVCALIGCIGWRRISKRL